MSGRQVKFRIGLAASRPRLWRSPPRSVRFPPPSQNPSSEILNALKPKGRPGACPARRHRARGVSAEDQRFLDGLRTKRTRSLSAGERDRVTALAKDKQSIDLEITFDYNSATISPQGGGSGAGARQGAVGPELKGSVFLVAGHTDAKGGDDYNQCLSEKRADAIKRYLAEKFGLQAENLVTVGYGKKQLKNTDNPLAPENRRVQVVNMEAVEGGR